MHPYVELASLTVRDIAAGKPKTVPPSPLPLDFHKQAGVFVSIKKDGELRGCIGTIAPTQKNIAEEIIENAISASTRDNRFNPIEETELGRLSFSVDVLSEPEDVSSIDQLDAKRYGVIVSDGARRGLLLPDLSGVDNPEQQIEICKRKAGISADTEVNFKRFTVTRYK